MSRNKDNCKDTSRIVGTLKHGSFIGDSHKRVVIVFCLFAGFILLSLAFVVTMLCIEQIKEPGSVASFILLIVLVVIGFSISPIVVFVILRRNEKIRKELNLWLDDAIEIKAYSKEIGDHIPSLLFPAAKIQVEFELNGDHYSFDSEGKQLWGENPAGYHRVWADYIDKEIDILYSPNYKQVMVLKNKKNKAKQI